jgi:hypothetical protein
LKEYGGQLDERIQALRQELQDSIVDNKRLWQEAKRMKGIKPKLEKWFA